MGWDDFGARNYDAAVGRFWSTDRFTEKYTSLTPYHYTANNPIKFIDINGDSIKINDINYTPDMQVSDDYDHFTNESIEALNFIHDNGGKGKMKKLIKSESNYTILESNELSSNYFEPISTIGGEIKFNTLEVAEFEDGTISAVTILAHELEHAYMNETLLQKANKTDDYDQLLDFQSPVPGSEAMLKEENRAVKGLEKKISKALGQYQRKSYDDTRTGAFESTGPFDNEY